jgi:putative addiction module component (TIGR02574 family)
MSIKELEAEAMKLDPEDRVRLGEKLLGSVPPTLDFEAEWAEEVDRRVAEVREGRAKLVSSEDMIREALDSLK